MQGETKMNEDTRRDVRTIMTCGVRERGTYRKKGGVEVARTNKRREIICEENVVVGEKDRRTE